jgi:hypothetical protein
MEEHNKKAKLGEVEQRCREKADAVRDSILAGYKTIVENIR